MNKFLVIYVKFYKTEIVIIRCAMSKPEPAVRSEIAPNLGPRTQITCTQNGLSRSGHGYLVQMMFTPRPNPDHMYVEGIGPNVRTTQNGLGRSSLGFLGRMVCPYLMGPVTPDTVIVMHVLTWVIFQPISFYKDKVAKLVQI